MNIHPTAIVEPGAKLGKNVEVGPFCHVGEEVDLRDRVKLLSHVVIEGATQIGEGTTVHPFAVLGGSPQHVNYHGEDTKLIIGAGTKIREHVTINRGTLAGGGVTRVGDGGFFMVGVHIGHDCTIGGDAIMAPNVAVGGHVEIGNNVFLGGQSALHQFCRVGDFAFVGGGAIVVNDIIPYASAMGNHANLVGLNVIGMKRRGMARAVIHDLRSAYSMLFSKEGTFKSRIEMVRSKYGTYNEVRHILEFIEHDASRPLMSSR